MLFDRQSGQTPVMYAAAGGSSEVVQLLLSHQADHTLMDKVRSTALAIDALVIVIIELCVLLLERQ